MGKAVSTRIPEEMAKKLDEIAEEKHLDRATLIRQMLAEDIEKSLIEKAAERYRKGEVSIEKAAEEAETSIWTMINHIERENITPPSKSTEELEKEYQNTVA